MAASPPTVMPPSPPPAIRRCRIRNIPVSSLSPFAAGCEGTPVNGTLYANAEVEPFVAVNPANAANLIGVWQQDRWSNGGAKGLLARLVVRWRPHVDDFDGDLLALHRRQRCERGRLRTCHRSVGHDRSRRDRVSDRLAVQRPDVRDRLVECNARQPIAGRWTQLEQSAHSDQRRRRQFQRQGIDHRRSDHARVMRMRCGIGSRQPGTGPRISAVRPTAARRGKRRDKSTIRARPARRSTTRSSCCPMARW